MGEIVEKVHCVIETRVYKVFKNNCFISQLFQIDSDKNCKCAIRRNERINSQQYNCRRAGYIKSHGNCRS